MCYATLLQLFDAHPLCEKNMVNSIDELTLRCKCIVAVLIKNLGHGVVLCGANLFLEACVMIDETSKTVPARAPHSTVTFRSVLKAYFRYCYSSRLCRLVEISKIVTREVFTQLRRDAICQITDINLVSFIVVVWMRLWMLYNVDSLGSFNSISAFLG